MKHCGEDDLILHYYGEHPRAGRVARHLAACAACAREMQALSSMLALVAPPAAPARDDTYGLEVWHRIRHRLPERESAWSGWVFARLSSALTAGSVVALLVTGAFFAGRFWPAAAPAPAAPATTATAAEGIAPEASERVRLAALADHFERSEHVLLDVATSGDRPLDVTDQQAWASELLTANRLYRDASNLAGDDASTALLDDLERTLLELVHGPAVLSPEELDQMRLRMEAAALLFKVRVMSDTLRDRETETPPPGTTT
jgi:hypothetical protein